MADNKITDPSDELDYRLGGETWDSWARKYMATIPYIFRVLNAINGTDDSGLALPVPAGAGALVRKNANGTVSVSIIGNASTSDKLKTPRTISLTGDASGSVSFDGSNNVSLTVSGVTGNANKIAAKQVDTTDIADGTILVYRSFENKFVFESKGVIGAGKTLTIKNGTEVLGTFSGDVPAEVDIGPSLQAVKTEAAGGNAATATKLQTARTINGTAFDGTGNITTARWGTARNITIKDATSTNAGTAVSVDGSGSIVLLLPGTIKANVTGSSSSCSGNASTATKLQTARSINGTNFDGSAAVTTAKWGTARNISIKDSSSTNTGTAVSVDGSGNITLILPAAIKANITGNVTGNATTATKLATARTINIQDSSATNTGTGASFDGSGNATIKLPATIKANVTGNVTGNVSGSSGSCTGNAATATKISGKTVAVVSSFDSSTGVLALTGLS